MSFLKNIKTPEQLEQEKLQAERDKRIAELKQFLANTDHKALNDYIPKEGEDMDKVHADRIAARDEIRLLEAG